MTEEQIKDLFEQQQKDVAEVVVTTIKDWTEKIAKSVESQLETYCEHTNKVIMNLSDALAMYQTRIRDFEEKLRHLECEIFFHKENHTTTDGDFLSLRNDFEFFKNNFETTLKYILGQEGFILGRLPEETQEMPWS